MLITTDLNIPGAVKYTKKEQINFAFLGGADDLKQSVKGTKCGVVLASFPPFALSPLLIR